MGSRAGDRPDPDLLQDLVHRQGVPLREVGARIGLSRAAGYSWLRRYGVTADAPVVAQPVLVAAWQAGRSMTEIASHTGLAESAVRERLTAAAVLRPTRQYFVVRSADDPLPEHLLRHLYVGQRCTAEQIATLTRTTARQVRYRIQRYRLSRSRPDPGADPAHRLPQPLLTDLYEQRLLSCRQIAARHQVTVRAVRALLDRYGIARRSRVAPAGEDQATSARVRWLYVDQQRTLREVALELGYLTPDGEPAVRRVRAVLRRAGVPTRRGSGRSSRAAASAAGVIVDDASLRRLYTDAGLTIAQVAARLGWLTAAGHPATTYTRDRLLAAGVRLRRPGPTR